MIILWLLSILWIFLRCRINWRVESIVQFNKLWIIFNLFGIIVKLIILRDSIMYWLIKWKGILRRWLGIIYLIFRLLYQVSFLFIKNLSILVDIILILKNLLFNLLYRLRVVVDLLLKLLLFHMHLFLSIRSIMKSRLLLMSILEIWLS